MLQKNKNIHTVVPFETYELLEKQIQDGKIVPSLAVFEKEIIYTLRRMTLPEIAAMPDVSDGLENRIKMAANNCNNLKDLITNIKSKQFTRNSYSENITVCIIEYFEKRYECFKTYYAIH